MHGLSTNSQQPWHGNLHTMRYIVQCNWDCTAESMVTICFQMTGRLWKELFVNRAQFRVDRRAAGDLQYKLGLDHLGICKPAMRSWNRLGDWQGTSVMWTVLVLCDWIHAARGPHEQHSSQFAKYDSIVYLWCHTTGCCSSQFWTSRRLV